MENIGKASKQEITALKTKHGDVYEVISVKDEDKHFTYVKKPNMDIISAASKYAESDPMKSGEIMFNSTRISGSDVVIDDDEMRCSFGIGPEELTLKKWAQLYQEALWLKRFGIKLQAEMLSTLFGGSKSS